jgi:hypothetical protein
MIAFVNYLLSVALANGNEEVDADNDIEKKMDIDEVRIDPDKPLLACNCTNEPNNGHSKQCGFYNAHSPK